MKFIRNIIKNILEEQFHTDIKEHDIVELLEDVPEIPLFVGDGGTVVHIYNQGEAYEVEFFRDNKTIAVKTMLPHQIKKI